MSMIRLLGPVYTLLIQTVPFGLAVAPVFLVNSGAYRVALVFAVPVLYAVLFLLVCGLLSLPFRGAIRNGRFRREVSDPVYSRRRLHATCWTSVYYSPCYPLFLSMPLLKRILFRLFGYKGNLDFVVYPDTWIRDLPVLDIGKGAYLSNKATIGSNMPLRNGRIFVEGVTIGPGAMLGHLSIVGPGTTMGENSTLVTGGICSARVTLGKNSVVHGNCGIDVNVVIGENVQVGPCCYVGPGAVIGDGIVLRGGGVIPRAARVETQEDADRFFASETQDLNELRKQLVQVLSARTLEGT